MGKVPGTGIAVHDAENKVLDASLSTIFAKAYLQQTKDQRHQYFLSRFIEWNTTNYGM
jgi:hypothetical protein